MLTSVLRHHDDAGSHDCTIQEGSLVVVYERLDAMKTVYVTADGTYGSRFGTFYMKDWIGKPYGSLARARGSPGWAYLLKASPELWSLTLRHRTQILYVADISLVCMMLELKPGSVVLESGTGSGSLTTSLARCVRPGGHVYTFEYHEQRAQAARDDFAANGIADVITVEYRNAVEQGFPEPLHNQADAVFLDLPAPDKVVHSAAQCLKSDGVLCSFSPCMEQVLRTAAAMVQHGFVRLRTAEILLRVHEVTSTTVTQLPEQLPAARQGNSAPEQLPQKTAARQPQAVLAADGDEQADAMGGEGDQKGPAAMAECDSQLRPCAPHDAADPNEAAVSMVDTAEANKAAVADIDNAAVPSDGVRVPSSDVAQGIRPGSTGEQGPEQETAGAGGQKRKAAAMQKPDSGASAGQSGYLSKAVKVKQVVSRPAMGARGHTGYLLFARKGVQLA